MKKRDFLRRGFCVVLAFLVLAPLFGPMNVIEARAKVTQSQINNLKDEAAELKDKKKDIQAQLKEVRSDKSKAVQQKNLLEDQIDVIQAEIDNIQAQIDAYNELITLKDQELSDAQAREQKQYELFCQRIQLRGAFVVKSGIYLNIVLGEGQILALLKHTLHNLGCKRCPASVFDK